MWQPCFCVWQRGTATAPRPAPRHMAKGFGASPHAPLRVLFEKNPENPKKPNCIGFRPSNQDNKQGCHVAALFVVQRKLILQSLSLNSVKTDPKFKSVQGSSQKQARFLRLPRHVKTHYGTVLQRTEIRIKNTATGIRPPTISCGSV